MAVEDLSLERRIVFLVGAIQFVNILDFMMVMPLGPDLSLALGVGSDQIGLIGGSYTAAACVAGIAGMFFLDRFDRRRALAVAMLGLVIATAAGGLAWDLWSLMAARVLAGLFGGPATALSLSIISDAIPVARRGRAMGAVMGAFSVASVLGVPIGLELARLGSWRTPFFSVAMLGLVVTVLAIRWMPPMREHLAGGPLQRVDLAGLWGMVRRPATALSLAASATIMFGNFALLPNLATYLQFNVGFPRERLGLLYMVGGAVSFFVLRVVGRLVDRYGAPQVAAGGTVLFTGVVWAAFLQQPAVSLVLPLFTAFMACNSFRMVPNGTISSRVPLPTERARFMSMQSAVQHFASSAGAVLGAAILTSDEDFVLTGIPVVASVTIAMALLLPGLLYLAQRALPLQVSVVPTAAAPARTAAVPPG